MKYKKKPVVIDAEQFWSEKPFPKGICECEISETRIILPHVHTIHNNQAIDVDSGDWIVAEPDGIHFYPVKPDIFDQTYEPVEEK